MKFTGTKNFSLDTDPKLACSCGCGMVPEQDFMEKVQAIRDRAGFPFTVTSAARCPNYNSQVSSTGRTGPHTTGRAIDIGARGEQAYRIVGLAMLMGFTGIGVNQKGGARFVHLDDLPNGPGCPRPYIWSY